MFVKQTNNLDALSEWPFTFQKNGPFLLMKMATYLLQFMQKHQILEEEQEKEQVDYFIGVSGGLDSMTLLALLWAIRKLRPKNFQNLTVVHINHGTRELCQEEQNFVERSASQLQVRFKTHKLSLKLGQSNFEMRAREERYQIFKKYFEGHRQKCWFYLAHQLDDSFEWSLLQSLKSSNALSTLGIPLVNGSFARPLLCLSRAQLSKLACAIGLPYRQDVSNFDPKFERGYLRQKIIPSIQERYPQYLANYASRANQLAHFFKLHRLWQNPLESACQLINDRLGGKLLLFKDDLGKMSNIEETLRQGVAQLSNQGRGRLRDQITRLIQAYGHRKIGPIHFSGGVLAYILPGLIHLLPKQKLPKYQEMDQLLAKHISSGEICLLSHSSLADLSSLTASLATSVYLLPMPLRVKATKFGLTAHFGYHPLFEQSSLILRGRRWKIEKNEENDQTLAPGLTVMSFLLTEKGIDVLRSRLPTLSTIGILELSPVEF